MEARQLPRLFRIALFFALAALLLNGYAALANANLRVTRIGTTSVSVEWDAVAGITRYRVAYEWPVGSDHLYVADDTSGTSYTITGLESNTDYIIDLSWDDGGTQVVDRVGVTTASNRKEENSTSEEPESIEPPPQIPTCPFLPPSVEVFGYVKGTECQWVGPAGVGNRAVLERGFIDAVDIWSYVNGGIDVCFRHTGALVFLDAAFSPRKLVELSMFERNGMTCGKIDGAGTVVLVHAGAPIAAPPAPGEPTLPAIDSAPFNSCLAKLTETLFLRAAPAGEIIGLVWLYSEVPVFETNGDWHKFEFEGRVGYISRRYVRVLHGGCA